MSRKYAGQHVDTEMWSKQVIAHAVSTFKKYYSNSAKVSPKLENKLYKVAKSTMQLINRLGTFFEVRAIKEHSQIEVLPTMLVLSK